MTTRMQPLVGIISRCLLDFRCQEKSRLVYNMLNKLLSVSARRGAICFAKKFALGLCLSKSSKTWAVDPKSALLFSHSLQRTGVQP